MDEDAKEGGKSQGPWRGSTPERPGGRSRESQKEDIKGHRIPRGHSTKAETGCVLSNQLSGALIKSSCWMETESRRPAWMRGDQSGGVVS